MPRPTVTYDKKPNPDAWQAQQAAYAAMPVRSADHPWTLEQVVTLGVLYYRTWGRLPTNSRMGPAYCLPTAPTVHRLCGTTANYQRRILDACGEAIHEKQTDTL